MIDASNESALTPAPRLGAAKPLAYEDAADAPATLLAYQFQLPRALIRTITRPLPRKLEGHFVLLMA